MEWLKDPVTGFFGFDLISDAEGCQIDVHCSCDSGLQNCNVKGALTVVKDPKDLNG